MKISNTTKFTLSIALAVLMLSSCKKNLEDMTEGMMFSLDMNSFLQNQVQVQVVNANYQNSATIPNAKIFISGKDAEKVFDINGVKTIVVEDQFANLAVSPGRPLSEGNPVRFIIKAEAPGFLPLEQEVLVNPVDSFLNYTFEMIEIANPPAGIQIATTSMALTGNQPENDLRNNNKTNFNAALIIPANTRLKDDAGNLFSGNAEIRLQQFDASFEPVKANMHNLIHNFSYNSYNMGIPEDLSFQPLGYVRVNIDNNNGRNLQFENPAQIEVVLSTGTADASTGEQIKAGDKLMVYQKDNNKIGWEFKEEIILTSDLNGNLKTRFTFTGTDEIALNRVREGNNNRVRNCATNLGLRFKRNSNVNTLHYITVVNAANPNQIYLTASNVAVANNSTYNFGSRLPQNASVKVLVYQFETATGKGEIVGQSAAVPSCTYTNNNRLEILVNPVQITSNPIARFQLYTVCLESKLAYFHEGRVQFRPAGSRAPYRDMGLAQKTGNNQIEITAGRIREDGVPGSFNYSYLETDRMVNNTTYQFKTEIIGKRKKDGKTVRKTYTRNRIFNLNEFLPPTTQTTPINYTYRLMNRSYWIAPEDACDDFGY